MVYDTEISISELRKNEERKEWSIEKMLVCRMIRKNKKIFKKVDKLMCHDKCIRATRIDTVSLEWLHHQSDNQKARGHYLRDEKVADLESLIGSFWSLLVTSFFQNKTKKQCGLLNLLTWKGFGVKDLMRYKATLSKNHPMSPITNFCQVATTSQLL